MTTLNQVLQPDRKPVSWLYENFRKDKIFVDNSFQRRVAWVEKNKARLIETILNGFPMPEIYLWANKPDPQSGATKYSVVDGQQRLTALREYISNGFALHSRYLNSENRSADYSGLIFSKLPDNRKEQIWDYQINTRIIPNSIKRDEIVKMFLRLNETDMALNPQELRHAEFNGKFTKNAEQIAEFNFWDKWHFFTPHAIRRMGDIQFVSSLLIFLRQGIEAEVTQSALNKAYDLYNDTYPAAKEDRDTFEELLSTCDKLFSEDDGIPPFFKFPVHFYALFISLYIAKSKKKAIKVGSTGQAMKTFISEYSKDRRQIVRDYRLAATEGTQKRVNREIRVNMLSEWLGFA